jgi:hypothetical protein
METGEDKEVGDATRDARRDAYRIQAKAQGSGRVRGMGHVHGHVTLDTIIEREPEKRESPGS